MTTATLDRDKGLDTVSKPKWINTAVDKFQAIKTDLPCNFTGEDVRLKLIDAGLEPPYHHNAWGAFTMKLVRGDFIEPTGDFRSMKTRKSHARITRIYRLSA